MAGSDDDDREARDRERRQVTVAFFRTLADAETGALVAAPGEGTSFPTPASSGRYLDRGEVAHGGMGSIRRSYDGVLRRDVAKKLLHPEGVTPETALRFLEEAQITGQLEHPNIVPVYDLAVSHDVRDFFFTMKLLGGNTLTHAITRLHAESFSDEGLERILRILLTVCDAVSFAHSRGVVHRDLKPQNIMVGSHGQVYVMDWGIAILLAMSRPSQASGGAGAEDAERVSTARDETVGAGEIIGTLSYMAPEQAEGRTSDIDARTDVFALGAILYEVLTGWPPYSGCEAHELLALARKAAIIPPQEASPRQRLPEGLCEIAMKALAADPARRHPTVEAFREDLARFLRGGGWLSTRTFRKGEEIVREGEDGDAGYVIVAGSCEVFQTRSGQRRLLRRMGPGDVFGETSILGAQPRTATVVALEDVTVKVITASALERELSLNTWVGTFVRQLTARFVEVEERLRHAEAASAATSADVPPVE